MQLIKYLFSFALLFSLLYPTQSRYDLIHNYDKNSSYKLPTIYQNYFPQEEIETNEDDISSIEKEEEQELLIQTQSIDDLEEVENKIIFESETDSFDTSLGESLDGPTLTYFGARYYDSFTGRWVSRDLYSGVLNFPQFFNRYSYSVNSPLNFIDPNGESIFDDFIKLFFSPAGTPMRSFTHDTVNNFNKVATATVDTAQTTLDIVGVIPVVGEFADGFNVVIHLVRGNNGDAALTALSLVPIFGDVIGKGGKVVANNKKVISGIYEWMDSNGKIYVGQSKDVLKRLEQHLNKGKLSPEDLKTLKIKNMDGSTKLERELAETSRLKEIVGPSESIKESKKVHNKVQPVSEKRLKEINN